MSSLAEHILVLDSQKEDLLRLADYLLAKGYQVQTASTLDRANELINNASFDLVFADLTNKEIPLLSLKQAEIYPIPLVVVSETPNSGDVVACLRTGASDFILKPVMDYASVDHVIDRILEKVRLSKQNKHLQKELEEGNKKLKAGLQELRADQRAGLQIQKKMLPTNDKRVNAFSFEYRVIPSLYLSGDFLDYFNLDDHRSLFYFADVSGHGASSAFATVLLKNLTMRLKRNFRRQSSDELSCPNDFLKRINQELLASDLGKHVTVFAGILDEGKKELRYSVGGHFPMPVYCAEGKAEYLQGKGMAVGLFPEPEFEVFHRELTPDFSITVFSDGILEVMPGETLSDKEQCLLDVVGNNQKGVAGLSSSLGLDDLQEIPDDIAILSVLSSC
jgi:sigma-B regulation protein RsbU (phosphoserine phosphatase)